MVLEPIASACDTHAIELGNDMPRGKASGSFLVSVAYFGDTSKQLKENLNIGLVQPHPNRIIVSDFNIANTLSIALETMENSTHH